MLIKALESQSAIGGVGAALPKINRISRSYECRALGGVDKGPHILQANDDAVLGCDIDGDCHDLLDDRAVIMALDC